MNSYQELWWEQAKSDHEAFVLVCKEGIAPCHMLHYLQMITEKIAKAYLWRSGSPPPRRHAVFVQFLRILVGQIKRKHQKRLAELFSFKRFSDFQRQVHAVLPMAYALEQLAPALANDGPNTEYPWPHQRPEFVPATYDFAVSASLKSRRGRELMRIIRIATERFPEYADI